MIAIVAAKVAPVAGRCAFASLVTFGNPATTANKLTDRCPLLAPLRHADFRRECPLIGEDRK